MSGMEEVMTNDERVHLIQEVYTVAHSATTTFEDLGPDLAYLMGAIAHDRYCEWLETDPIMQFLYTWFPSDHKVWKHVRILIA